MNAQTMARHLKITVLGILIAVFYALQHALSKPLADKIAGSVSGQLTLILITEIVVFLFACSYLMISNGSRMLVRTIIFDSKSLNVLIFTSILGYLNLAIYLFCLKNLSTVLVSLLLNTGVIWSGVLSRFMRSKNYSNWFWESSGFALVVLSLAAALKGIEASKGLIFTATLSVLTLCVPFIYNFGMHFREKQLNHYSFLQIVLASQIISSTFSFIALFIAYFLGGWRPIIELSDSFDIAFFTAGVMSLSICATLLWHITIRITDGDTSYTSSFSLLTPFFTATFSYIVYIFLGEESLRPNIHDLWPAFFIAPILLIMYIKNIPSPEG